MTEAINRALRCAWLLDMEPAVAAAAIEGQTPIGVENAYRAFSAEARRQREFEAGFHG